MLNIVVPMAGRGSRFAEAGYVDPKPLIPIHGKPMIQWVIKNLTPKISHRFIFIAQREHAENYGLANKLATWAPGSALILLDGTTDGAARTVLEAKALINNENPLVIANSDQWIDADFNEFIKGFVSESVDGMIMTMEADDPKWSFVDLDQKGLATRVVEKEVISNFATVGIYGFARGSDFVKSAERMIAEDFKVNGEFYVAPAYNWLIQEGKSVGIFPVGSEADGMYGLGIPSDLDLFINHPVSQGVWID